MPIPAFTTTLQKTHIEMCRVNIHGHTDSKCFLQSSIYEVVIQEWTFTIRLPNFYSVIFVVFYLKCFQRKRRMRSFLFNLSRNWSKCKIEKEKIKNFLSVKFEKCKHPEIRAMWDASHDLKLMIAYGNKHWGSRQRTA